MAQNNRREIELALSITTANADALTNLQKDVRDLAKEGGDAAPAFQQLADELGQLAAQAKQLTALEGLTQELQATATAQKDAAQTSGTLKQRLSELVDATNAARAAERDKNQELNKAKLAAQEAQDAVTRLKNDTDAAGKTSAKYADDLRGLTTVVLDAKARKRELTAELDKLKLKTQEAAEATTAQGKAYKAAEKDTRAVTVAMGNLQTQVDGVTAKYAEAGGATGDLATAQRELEATANGVRKAVQSLITDQERLAQAEREAAQEARQQSAIIEATKSRLAAQAKAEADGIIADYKRMEQAQRDAAQSAKAAGEAIAGAFGTVGQRSAQEIHQEIDQVREAMRLLATSGAATGSELATAMRTGEAAIKDLQREIREVTGTLTLADKAANLFRNSIGQITAGNLLADGIGYLVEKVKEAGRAFVTANLDMDRLVRTMTQITGSAEGAAKQIAFLREVANRAGVSVSSITDSFIRFQAAASASGVATQEINSIFQAVTVSGSKMGISAERVSLALDALGQIASKGTVSMEELRQQLGDSLPGATAIAAKGLGLTTAELTKLVESGQLTAEEFFPAFRRGLEETFGSSEKNVEGLVQAVSRLSNKFIELYQRATGSAAFKALETSADALTRNFESLVTVIGGLGQALIALKLLDYVNGLRQAGEASKQAATSIAAQTAATQASTAATTANTVVKAANSTATATQGTAAAAASASTSALAAAQAADTTATAANTQAKTANTIATRAQAAANTVAATAAATAIGGVQALGAAAGAAAGAARTLFAAMGGLPGVFVAVALNARELGTWLGETVAKWGAAGDAMRKYEREMAAQAEREKQLASEREAAQAKALQAVQREVAALLERRKVLVAEEATAQKATEAQAKRAELIERTANLYADEAKALAAAEQATRTNLAASESEISARDKLLVALQDEITKREALLAGSTVRNEKATEELQKLRDLLGLKTQEQEKLKAVTDLLRIESAERRIASETYKDNSENVTLYKDSLDEARKTLAELQAMEKAGLPVKEAVANAERNIAVQTRLYNDAVKDKIAQMQAESALEQANLNVKTSGLQVRQQELLSLAASAKETGNLTEAVRLEIEAKKVQIEITRINAEAKRLEAESTINSANAELEQLRTTGSLTEAKRLEIEARIANAKAKQTEALGSESAVRNLEREIKALQTGTAARRGYADAIDQETAARERAIAAQEKELDLKTRELKLQEAKRTAGTIQGVDGVPSFETQAQADAWLQEWKTQYQRDNPFSTRSGGQLGNFMQSMTMFEFNKEIDAMKLRNAMKGNGNASTSTQTPLESMRSTTPTAVYITLDGTQRQINTDAAGAATLQQVLKGLGNASTRAS